MKAFSCGLSRSMRLRHARVSSTGETFFVLMRADALSMLRNASASEDGANLESALVFAVSFALACDPSAPCKGTVFSWVRIPPGKLSLQPVVIGAAVEATKRL